MDAGAGKVFAIPGLRRHADRDKRPEHPVDAGRLHPEGPGDFLAAKWSGRGREKLHALQAVGKPHVRLGGSMDMVQDIAVHLPAPSGIMLIKHF